MTLAILDDLTPGDLTGGKRVAVTGTIDPDGDVGEIGGIAAEGGRGRSAARAALHRAARAANDRRAAREPTSQRAKQRVGKGVEVVPVSTFAAGAPGAARRRRRARARVGRRLSRGSADVSTRLRGRRWRSSRDAFTTMAPGGACRRRE